MGLQDALHRSDTNAARQAALAMKKKTVLIGQRADKKTRLADKVLDELNVGGCVTKKTQLEIDDATRTPEMP